MTTGEHLELEIVVDRAGDEYQASTRSERGARATTTFPVPFTALERAGLPAYLAPVERRALRAQAPLADEAARAVGQRLFDALFGVRDTEEQQRRKRVALRRLLTRRFNPSELRMLCFDLGGDYDNLTGSAHEDKVISFIDYFERRDGLDELLQAGRELRPDVPWEALGEEAGEARTASGNPLRERLLALLTDAVNRNASLRLSLDLTGAPELVDLPWEMLFDGAHERFLALDGPLLRFDGRDPQLAPRRLRLPLRVLVLVAQPYDHLPFDSEATWARVRDALAPLADEGRLVVDRLETGTWEALGARLDEATAPYHVLHALGPSDLDAQGRPALVMEDAKGNGRRVTADELARVANGAGWGLVVLDPLAPPAARPLVSFVGLAQALVENGVPTAVTVHHAMRPDATHDLLRALYGALTTARPLPDAVTAWRRTWAARSDEGSWTAPILVSRLRTGNPFDPSMEGLIFIPAGPFEMGGRYSNELPRHTVDVGAFYLARYPVTNEAYRRFVEAGGYHDRRYWTTEGWAWVQRHRRHAPHPHRWQEVDWGAHADHPVQWLSWYEALAYVRWLAETTGEPYRLPTEAEWEKAASWEAATGTKREYPWGADFDPARCNLGGRWTTPVGFYSPAGDSPYGIAEMAGQVWEWTSSLRWPYPYDRDDGREALEAEGERVFRGGSWANADPGFARCASRYLESEQVLPTMNSDRGYEGPCGVRVALDVRGTP